MRKYALLLILSRIAHFLLTFLKRLRLKILPRIGPILTFDIQPQTPMLSLHTPYLLPFLLPLRGRIIIAAPQSLRNTQPLTHYQIARLILLQMALPISVLFRGPYELNVIQRD